MFVRMSMANAEAFIMCCHMSTHCQNGMQQLLILFGQISIIDAQQPTMFHFSTLKSVMFSVQNNIQA